uniref:NADH dehydrogenase subunit 6 n=1 Tax=Diploptera punctata TaxID=6984 RepID=UPI0027AA98B5|nr:NADH dehydrogenase subunit 6 [Diploptera punctata]WGO57220.1 NADH dehydrogenase subunit 6 [Diploptera punctata]
MKLIILNSSLITSFIFTQMNHPLAMGLILLIQTTFISMLTGLTYQSFWFSYILFLIFLGGMLVLFIYVTSLASNEMFKLSTKLMLITSIMVPMLSLLFYNFPFPIYNQETLNLIPINNLTTLPLIKLYNFPTNVITLMLASYLFLTLIVVVKIVNIFKGPLRHMT